MFLVMVFSWVHSAQPDPQWKLILDTMKAQQCTSQTKHLAIASRVHDVNLTFRQWSASSLFPQRRHKQDSQQNVSLEWEKHTLHVDITNKWWSMHGILHSRPWQYHHHHHYWRCILWRVIVPSCSSSLQSGLSSNDRQYYACMWKISTTISCMNTSTWNPEPIHIRHAMWCMLLYSSNPWLWSFAIQALFLSCTISF